LQPVHPLKVAHCVATEGDVQKGRGEVQVSSAGAKGVPSTADVDRAVAAFEVMAGARNAAMLRDFVSAHLVHAAALVSAFPQQGTPTAIVAAQPGEPDAASTAAIERDEAAAGRWEGDTDMSATAEATLSAATGGAASTAADMPMISTDPAAKPVLPPLPPASFLMEPIADKATRTAVHAFFKTEQRLPSLTTETQQEPPSKVARGGAGMSKSGGVIRVSISSAVRVFQT
jgi:hypothetical protein